MRRIIDISARVISALCYPLWMPTYGVILFCCTIQHVIPLPWTYWLIMVGLTAFLTGLLPLALILYQVKAGYIQDIYITQREERTLAYIETSMGFAFWWYMLRHVVEAPLWLCDVALGATIAIVLVAVINRFWKISAHLTGMGGMLGGLFVFALTYHTNPMLMVILWLVLTLIVMYARLYLKAHTPGQVIAGLALGLSCTICVPILVHAL
ncbi:MAG: hypothetical protein MJZ75_05260 [Paludibacteraceae bacterium]|nr:hypothetical protein [Paludibacteraceae bacterium]